MIHGELLNIEPSEVKFLVELKKQISSTVHLSNISESPVAFKVFTTNPRKYWVQPKTGVIQPRATCDVILYMQPQNEAPPDILCMDRFLIQSMVASQITKPGDLAAETLTKESHLVYEYKLKVAYISPHQECASLNVRSKSFPVRKPAAENEEGNGSEVARAVSDIKYTLSETCIGTLLKIVPSQLKFLFELNREMSCSLQLTNISKHPVGFKVKTSNPRQYSVRPYIGTILPQTTCDITVRMQAQKDVASYMQCKDKFVLQSVISSPGATTMDIDPEIFNKEAGYDVEDYVFPVVFLSPTLPPVRPVNEELEGCLEACQMKTGNLNGSEVAETFFSDQEKIRTKSASFGDEEISIGDLLTVKPSELKFPFKLKTRISCSLHLTNLTEKHVAFKVRATNPEKYVVQPHAGFISPQSEFHVVVILLPQKRAPPDFEIQGKFLLQCVVANPGSTSKDAMRELFTKEAAFVKECKLKVSYIPSAGPHLLAAEGTDESSLESAPMVVQNDQSSRSRSSSATRSLKNHSETSDAEQDEQLSQPKLLISEGSRESSSPATSEEKNESSKSSEGDVKPDSNGRQVNGWAILCVVVVLLGIISSCLNGSGLIYNKMVPVMMKTVLEMVSDMVGDWVVKALVIVCFQRLFGHHMNNNN